MSPVEKYHCISDCLLWQRTNCRDNSDERDCGIESVWRCVCGGCICLHRRLWTLSPHLCSKKSRHCQPWMSTVVGHWQRALFNVSLHMYGVGSSMVGVIPSPGLGG